MWINILDEGIPTYGKHGQTFLLYLRHKLYYGHELSGYEFETVTAIWNSVNECFYEKETKLEIDASEILEWWKDI